MIQKPDLPLFKTLDAAEDASEHDRILASIWKQFDKSEAYQALQLFFHNLEVEFLAQVTSAHVTDGERAYFSGAIRAVHILQVKIAEAINFDPALVQYDTPVETDASGEPGSADPSEVLY